MLNKKEAKRISPHSSFFPKNQRGQGLSTNAMILIILGVVVLVLLIIGFTMGWGTIAPWIKTNNVDTIATACEVACSTGSTYDYCNVKREIKLEENLKEGENTILNKKGERKTCNELSKITQLKIGECPSIQPCST